MREKAASGSTTKVNSRTSAPGLAEAEEASVDSLAAENEVAALEPTESHPIAKLVHDLRTPLVSIRGYTKMILEERAGPINATQREYLRIVGENSKRVVELVNNLAQLTSSQPLRFEAFDARGLWKDIVEVVRQRDPGKTITMAEPMPSAPMVILGDRQKLTEVFANLLFTAFQFTGVGSSSPVMELSSAKKGEASITISYKRAELSAEMLDQIISSTASPLGLPSAVCESRDAGLSVLRDVIRLHGGRIAVSAKTGGCAVLSVTLPAL